MYNTSLDHLAPQTNHVAAPGNEPLNPPPVGPYPYTFTGGAYTKAGTPDVPTSGTPGSPLGSSGPTAPPPGQAPGRPNVSPGPTSAPAGLPPSAPSLAQTPASLEGLLGRSTSAFQQPSVAASLNNPILAAISGSITRPAGPAASVPQRAQTPFGGSQFSPDAQKARWLQANGLV